jgi:hypothetical protein
VKDGHHSSDERWPVLTGEQRPPLSCEGLPPLTKGGGNPHSLLATPHSCHLLLFLSFNFDFYLLLLLFFFLKKYSK